MKSLQRIKDYDSFMDEILFDELIKVEVENVKDNNNNSEFLGDYDLEKYAQYNVEEINEDQEE